jgi:LysM repeat protein
MGDYGIFESIEGSEGERKIASRGTQRKLDAAIDDVKRQYGAFLYASRDGEEWNDRVALCKNDMLRTVDAHLMPVTGVMRRIVKACKDDWRRLADKTGPELKPKGDWEAYLKSVDENSQDAVDNCFKEGYRYADNGIGAAPEGQTAGTGVPTSDPISQAAAAPIGIPGIQASRYLYADDDNTFGKKFKSISEVGLLPYVTNNYGRGFEPSAAENAAAEDAGKYDDDGPIGGPRNGPSPGTPKAVSPAVAPVNQVTPAAAAPAAAAPAGNGGGAGGGGGDNGGGGGGGVDAAPAQRPMTSGDVADGGVAGAENGNNAGISGKDYTVQQGDTLTDIAQRGYGDMNKYDDLAKANGISNPDQLTVGQPIKALDGADFSGNGGVFGDKTNPAGGGSDNNISTVDAGPGAAPAPAAPAPAAPAPAPLAAEAPKLGSLAVAQYIDWCDSFGARRASVDTLDKYAANLNDQAYFEIASALTDSSSPIYRIAAPGAGGGNSAGAPQSMGAPGGGAPLPQANGSMGPMLDQDGAAIDALNPMTVGDHNQLNNISSGMGSLWAQGGEHEARRKTAAPDYLQKADEALTNLLNQKAEEFQETIQPLQQALQTVQQAEQAQAAMNPMGVQPPAGTVNVLPGQGDPAAGGDPSMGGGMPPGGDPSQGGGDPMAGLDPAMLQQLLGDPSGGQGGPPPGDPSQMQMQARRRQARPNGCAGKGKCQDGTCNHRWDWDSGKERDRSEWRNPNEDKQAKRGGQGKGRGASSPKVADVVNTYNKGWGTDKVPGLPTGNPEVDIPQYETQTGKPLGPKQRNKLTKPVSTATPMPKSKRPITTPIPKTKMSRQASFFTRKVAGWEWDDHLNGYLASKSTPFTCKCGSKHAVPSYSTCKCGKIWNSYVIGTGGDNHQASVEKFICREIPVRDNVIVAQRKQADCNCWKGYERVPGTKPCAEGSCRKCDGHRKESRQRHAGGWQQLMDRRKKTLERDRNQQKFDYQMPGGMKMIKYTEDEEEPGRVGGKVKRHNLSDPGPLGNGKDDKMPDINDDLGQDWHKRGPGGKYARKNRRGR